MSFCAHNVASRAAAVVDEMTAPDVTASSDRNDRADRHERVDISEEIQNARVWAAVLQQHVVPSPQGARCHRIRSQGSLFPVRTTKIMSAYYGCMTHIAGGDSKSLGQRQLIGAGVVEMERAGCDASTSGITGSRRRRTASLTHRDVKPATWRVKVALTLPSGPQRLAALHAAKIHDGR